MCNLLSGVMGPATPDVAALACACRLARSLLSYAGMRRPSIRGATPVVVLGVVVAACGGDDESTMMTTSVGSTVGASSTLGDDTGDAETDESGGDPSGDPSGDPGGNPSGDPSGDPTADPTGDEDDSAAGTCDFDMSAAVRLTVDVSWEGGIAVLAGSGSIDIWLLAELDGSGTDVALSGGVCRIELPDFQTGLLAGNETYGTMFPDASWSSPTMPKVDATVMVSSQDPGATLHLERGAVVLGGTMTNPLDDPWPADWHALATADHDGDGAPGVTAEAKTGGSYAYPRIDILNTDARAEQLYLVSRTIIELDGVIDTCDTAAGDATITMENHNVGCATVGGGACSDGQTTTLDNNLPVFGIDGGSFELVRLPDGSGCDAVFGALP